MRAVRILVIAAVTLAAASASGQPACPNNQPTVTLRRIKLAGRAASPESLTVAPLVGEQHCLPALIHEAGDRLRAAYQESGYFKATVRVELDSISPLGVELYATVNAGPQYRLKDIEFSGASLVAPAELRLMFPIDAGDIFDTSKVRKGLEAVRREYADRGYRNVFPVAEVRVDEALRAITLVVAIDEELQTTASH